ncbi:Plant intracellular Ras-group-related LRR protein 1 [Hondaea fermentalgiana]|uniref:Plant intracellular Ras-group-related LRR protein 1 n=1 Tax=Hondaea fermentalgiana TaxID=2315210 RepID=A0A2R5GHS6_9STRA|nr:Plant intracellular Ras-group-related LRR protein 1 [Hondaea fermentalgiana]|eukprot:GBG30446.1 Plant intracellular Ras-group-related LRR protein 1 [Hondaea fermentalgiana]
MGAASSVSALETEHIAEIAKVYGIEETSAEKALSAQDAADNDDATDESRGEDQGSMSAPDASSMLDALNAFAEAHDPWLKLVDADLADIDLAIEDLEEEEIDSEEEIQGILADATPREMPRNIRVLDAACDIMQVVPPPAAGRHHIVALDLTENATPSAEQPMRIGLPWLRKLSLGSASVASRLDLHGLWRLAILDISYIQTSDNSAIDFQPLAGTLQRLVADGCGWTSLPASISALKNLRALAAQENELTDIHAVVATIAWLEGLRELDFRENPFQECTKTRTEYASLLHTRLPKLELLDNHLLKESGANVPLQNLPHFREDMNRSDTVADANEDRGSCSCIEGTPCAVEYTCKDWKHRNEIAAYVREHGTPPTLKPYSET